MMITRNNLNEILFENQDARLLIERVVSHTQATLYYYHDVEITVEKALEIYNRAVRAEEEDGAYVYHSWIFPEKKTNCCI